MTYGLGKPVVLHIRAIHVFLSAESGQRFLTEFVEVGGVPALLGVFLTRKPSVTDKLAAIKLLSLIARAGRHYKEVICESNGLESLHELMTSMAYEDLVRDSSELLASLCRSNPRYAAQAHLTLLSLLASDLPTTQRYAAASLRSLLSQHAAAAAVALPDAAGCASPSPPQPSTVLEPGDAHIDAAIRLLNTANLQVQYEAEQLLNAIFAWPMLQLTLLSKLVEVVADLSEKEMAQVPPRTRSIAAHLLAQLLTALPTEARSSYSELLDVVPWLCFLLLSEKIECQRSAIQALQLLGCCSGSPAEDIERYLCAPLHQTVLHAVEPAKAAASIEEEYRADLAEKLEDFIARQRARQDPAKKPLFSTVVSEADSLFLAHGDADDSRSDTLLWDHGSQAVKPDVV